MSELRRLVDEESDELVLSLLRSADDDAPSAEGKSRALVALGIPGASLGVAGGAAGGASAGAGAAAAKGKLFGFAAWKWAASMLTLGVALGGAKLALPDASAPSYADEVHLGVPAATAPRSPSAAWPPAAAFDQEPAPVSARATVALTVAPLPPPPSSPPAAIAPPTSLRTPASVVGASSGTPAAVVTPGPSGLGVELASLDEVRTALASGQPSRALARLDRYEREGGPHVLAEEATVLRIEALSANGDARGARALATQFLATHPSTTYEDRVRAILPATPPDGPAADRSGAR